MKIRQGFVSNSSSSSFCILGIVLDRPEISEDIIDAIESNTELNLQYGISDYYEQKLAGMYPSQMRDDETLLQFKQRIADEFKKANIDVNVDELEWCTDGGYDG